MTDIFKDKKLVHVKLDKDTHFTLKTELLKAGISMQEFLAEYCRQYINGSTYAHKIVENYITKKNKYKLQELINDAEQLARAKKEKNEYVDVDRDVIYDLLDKETPLKNHEKDEK